MIDYEVFMNIKILFQQGKSIREIARLLNLSRNTVRQALKQPEKPTYSRKKTRISKLMPFYGYVKERVQAAHPDWLPATVLNQEIVEQGYQGSVSLLRTYLRTLKPQQEPSSIIRFETPPGQQMQVDWIVFRRRQDRLSAFVATLGYSRASFVEFVTHENLDTLLHCHENAFSFFGGVPREILYDNMKTVVITRNAYAPHQHRFQPRFLDFAGHYGYVPRLCRPYRAQTKGKVERFNRYLRYSFYNPLVSQLRPLGLLLEVSLANYKVLHWLNHTANQRIHGTTGEVPLIRLQQEKPYLQPLPPPYLGFEHPSSVPHALQEFPCFQHPLSVYDQLLRGGA